MTNQNEPQESNEAVYATAGKIVEALNEPQKAVVNRVVWTLGIEQSRALLDKTLDIEANAA